MNDAETVMNAEHFTGFYTHRTKYAQGKSFVPQMEAELLVWKCLNSSIDGFSCILYLKKQKKNKKKEPNNVQCSYNFLL